MTRLGPLGQLAAAALWLGGLAGCSGAAALPTGDAAGAPDATAADATGSDAAATEDAPRAPLRFVAVTFNTGTAKELIPSSSAGGYGAAAAATTDEWYGNGLNWPPLIAETAAFFAATAADIVVFQEIFHPGDCALIPPEAQAGFVCETWQAGDPTVAQMLLGDGFQVMCHPGKPDKCAAVRRTFGTFRGCAADLCLEGMAGTPIAGCGRGARVARGVIDLAGGGALTLINVHGTSGFDDDEAACRVAQVDRIFVDFGDGAPGISAQMPNLILGDFNTDPGRLFDADPSAARWWDFVGDTHPFHFVSAIGEDAPPTYAGFVTIDHVVSDALAGACWSPGVTEGHPAFTERVYFDHLPTVCSLAP